MPDYVDLLTDVHLETLSGQPSDEERRLLHSLWAARSTGECQAGYWMEWYPPEWFADAGVPYDGSAASAKDALDAAAGTGYVYSVVDSRGRSDGWIRIISAWSMDDDGESFMVQFSDSFIELMNGGLGDVMRWFGVGDGAIGGCEDGQGSEKAREL